ncbi:MAG: aminotransferase class I/II-fold pyridoxal phosphate-dependent enzyme [Leptolyngbyaceae bacterium]|nr:aminotransferase class I/II-fold pyridoxal phosphate-dependent enzyme [Leptolyngbyaceae bacterium]
MDSASSQFCLRTQSMNPDPNLQASMPLLDALRDCVSRDHAPFYTPGHKRGQATPTALAALLGAAVFQSDLPELPELDNLFAPQGAIQSAQELAAAAFGAEKTWFLVNGSTCGIIAGILATCNPGDRILLPRNVHQSAISGLVLSGAIPIFLEPEYDPVLDLVHSVTPESVAMALEQYPGIKAVMLVYPTYYGVCGEIAAIAQIVHSYRIPLLVDEAHGPHFAFHPDLPTPALAAGADLVVQSTHKVLTALTQAAMLHTQGDYIDSDRVSRALQLVQSTSPSYLLLASLDAARHQMVTEGRQLLSRTLELANFARTEINQIRGLSVLAPAQPGSPGFYALDQTRLTVTVAQLGLTGFAADTLLHEQLGITAELPSLQHLTFIISVGNTETDIQRLVEAFKILSREHGQREKGQPRGDGPDRKSLSQIVNLKEGNHGGIAPTEDPNPKSKTCPERSRRIQNPKSKILLSLSPREAFFAGTETLAIADTVGRISAELVCPYPPGIPVLLPGEVITATGIAYLQQVLTAGGLISGCADSSLQTLKVVRQ